MTKGRAILYSAEELAWIEEHREMTRRDLHRFFVMFFERNDVTLDQIKALCTRKGWKSGRDGRLKPGNVPANKGKKMPYNAASARTQFKKGQRPHSYRGPGHEYVCKKDGYVWLIVAERNPHTGAATRPVMKHRWLWEQKNGPVPKGHVLKCLDSNKQNTDPDNWIAIPQGMLPRLAGRWSQAYDDAPPELKPTLLAAARVAYAAREARRKTGNLTPQQRSADRRSAERRAARSQTTQQENTNV